MGSRKLYMMWIIERRLPCLSCAEKTWYWWQDLLHSRGNSHKDHRTLLFGIASSICTRAWSKTPHLVSTDTRLVWRRLKMTHVLPPDILKLLNIKFHRLLTEHLYAQEVCTPWEPSSLKPLESNSLINYINECSLFDEGH